MDKFNQMLRLELGELLISKLMLQTQLEAAQQEIKELKASLPQQENPAGPA
jgi:hypothetical protein